MAPNIRHSSYLYIPFLEYHVVIFTSYYMLVNIWIVLYCIAVLYYYLDIYVYVDTIFDVQGALWLTKVVSYH